MDASPVRSFTDTRGPPITFPSDLATALTVRSVQRRLDLDLREGERLHQHLGELVEDTVGDLSGVEGARERPEEARLALSARGARPVLAGLPDEQAHDQRHGQEDHAGRDVFHGVEAEGQLGVLHDQGADRRREDPCDQAAPQPPRDRRDHDRQHEEGDGDLGS